jgi:adenylate cyclase
LATERVERRLAAILAADVAGYSRLMGANEEGTLVRLKAHRRELIDSASKSTRAASSRPPPRMLVGFGSVVDALRRATEMQAGRDERNSPGASALDLPREPDRAVSMRVGQDGA